jgi:hypothetical protein
MDSKLLVGLIKEVVKNEVKQQVKEELAKLIKSGAVTLNKERKQPTSLKELSEVNEWATPIQKQQPIQQRPAQIKEYTKNPALNEVLSMTTPFTAAQRAEGGMAGAAGGSVLDMLQPEKTMEEDWETMDYRMINDIPQNMPNFQSTGDGLQDATIKALTRDYSALTKVFAEQEKQKKGR